MGIFTKSPMPASKHDKAIPYTYEARVDLLHGRGSEPMVESYFADTLCGIVSLVAEEGLAAGAVCLYAVYRKEQAELDLEPCLDEDGRWLSPPKLCRSLEQHFATTRDERYRGHVEHSSCTFEDRDRRGHGPY